MFLGLNNIIENFANENEITDKVQFSQMKREELAMILLELNAITYSEIAGLCNLSIYRVAEINKQKDEQS